MNKTDVQDLVLALSTNINNLEWKYENETHKRVIAIYDENYKIIVGWGYSSGHCLFIRIYFKDIEIFSEISCMEGNFIDDFVAAVFKLKEASEMYKIDKCNELINKIRC